MTLSQACAEIQRLAKEWADAVADYTTAFYKGSSGQTERSAKNADDAEAAFTRAVAALEAKNSQQLDDILLLQGICDEREAENQRLRAFHEAWVNSEVSHATGNPDLVKKLRAELVAAHYAIRTRPTQGARTAQEKQDE